MTNTRRPLEGVLVVSVEQAVAAPYASSRLADAGARVIKVERPDGGDFARYYDGVAHGESAYFVWLNRGKESIVLDVKDKRDFAVLNKIISKADVFIQNLAPGKTEKLGLGSQYLRNQYPKLITCDISGYGDDGPYRAAKAYDLLIQCESGLASITGTAAGAGRVGVSVCDIATGMNAHTGIVEALFERTATGQGRGVSISMFDSMADWMTVPLLCHDYASRVTPRIGLHHATICPYGAFACADGSLIVLAIQNHNEWVRFCRHVMGDIVRPDDPRFATNDDRMVNRSTLEAMIGDVFAARTRDDMIEILKAADIAFGAVNDVGDLSIHPQLKRVEVNTVTGPVSYAAPPIRRSDEELSLGPVPTVGEHSDAIRKEFQ